MELFTRLVLAMTVALVLLIAKQMHQTQVFYLTLQATLSFWQAYRYAGAAMRALCKLLECKI